MRLAPVNAPAWRHGRSAAERGATSEEFRSLASPGTRKGSALGRSFFTLPRKWIVSMNAHALLSVAPPLVDPFGRAITYLRVSVTDRCDFRCVYCMSEDMN